MAVQRKLCRMGNKYEKTGVFGSSASLGWYGEGPGRRGGRQVASTESHSGVASYHAGVWLGPTGWLVTSDGRGQHSVRLHESPPVDQASKT